MVVNHTTLGLLTVDRGQHQIILVNKGERDRLVGQYQVPPGAVSQIRIFPSQVTVVLKDGTSFDATENPNIPSWKQSGWKVEPVDGVPWTITDGQLTGVRGLFQFDDQMIFNKGNGYKFRPTMLAELFAVNPPPMDPGFFADQITVVFKSGTTPSQVDTINAPIGASVVISPILGSWYRIKLPPSTNLLDAFNYYEGRAEVAGCMPATNYGLFSTGNPTDGLQLNHIDAGFPGAWGIVENAIGAVGSHQVKVAIIDTGVALDNVDIARNIAINQGEIPPAVRAMLTDVDGDGLITFDDLNDPANAAVIPMLHPDVNHNGIVDAKDLLASSAWIDGIDQDDFDGDPATFVDDLVGWNFNDNPPIGTNDPSCNDISCAHGTNVASVLGAVGDNGIGIAGTAWRVSIVPLRVTPGGDHSDVEPDLRFFDAAAYGEQQHVDIANVSFGWHYASKNADLTCANTDLQMTTDIPQDVFDKGTGSAERALSVPPFNDGQGRVTSRVLYVFAAGNSSANLGQFDIVSLPSEAAKSAMSSSSIESNVMIVGSTLPVDTTSGIRFVASDSNYGDPYVDFYAPGISWNVENPDATVTTSSGTSFSAPVTAGTAALLLSKDSTLRGHPTMVRDKLISTGHSAVGFLPANPFGAGDCRTSTLDTHALNAASAVQ